MARARNIKPSFFVDEDLVELSFSTRLLFIGLWTLADREGRLPDKPKSIKMSVFPCDRVDVDKGLNELQTAGFLTRYVVDAKGYIEIHNFAKHQRPHPNEAASEMPEKPPVSTIGRSTREMSEPIRSSLNSELLSLNSECGSEALPPLPPADFVFEPSAFEHPAVVVYQERFQVKLGRNAAGEIARRVSDLGVWHALIDDKIAYADDPLDKRQKVATWILRAYEEAIERKVSGNGLNGKGGFKTAVMEQPFDEMEFQRRLRKQDAS